MRRSGSLSPGGGLEWVHHLKGAIKCVVLLVFCWLGHASPLLSTHILYIYRTISVLLSKCRRARIVFRPPKAVNAFLCCFLNASMEVFALILDGFFLPACVPVPTIRRWRAFCQENKQEPQHQETRTAE